MVATAVAQTTRNGHELILKRVGQVHFFLSSKPSFSIQTFNLNNNKMHRHIAFANSYKIVRKGCFQIYNMHGSHAIYTPYPKKWCTFVLSPVSCHKISQKQTWKTLNLLNNLNLNPLKFWIPFVCLSLPHSRH